MMKDKSPGFAGFLQGYKASNIAGFASSLKYHLDEIRNILRLIIEQKNVISDAKEIVKSLDKAKTILEQNDSKILDQAFQFGEVLKTILIDIKKSTCPTLSLDDKQVRKIVYHFLEFAEKSEDKLLGDLAIEIGELF